MENNKQMDAVTKVFEEMNNNVNDRLEYTDNVLNEEFKIARDLKSEFKNDLYDKNLDEISALKSEIKALREELKNTKLDDITLSGLLVKGAKNAYMNAVNKLDELQEKTVGSLKNLYGSMKNQLNESITTVQKNFVEMKINIVQGMVNAMSGFLREQQEKLQNCLDTLDKLSNEIESDKGVDNTVDNVVDNAVDNREINSDFKENDDVRDDKFKIGDIIKTHLSDNTIVMDINNDTTTLFTGSKFIVVGDVSLNDESGKFEWIGGKYANNLDELNVIRNSSPDKMFETIKSFEDNNSKAYTMSVIGVETGIDDIRELEAIFNEYIKRDDVMLLNDEFAEIVNAAYIDPELRDELSQEDNLNINYKTDKSDNIFMKNENANTNSKVNENLANLSEAITEKLKGNIASDIVISEHTSKDGREFKVASFSIAQNSDAGVKFTNCLVYDKNIKGIENMKKGDFIELSGKTQLTQDKNGKEHSNFKVYGSKLLKAKDQKKESVMGKLNSYKEKVNEQKSTPKQAKTNDKEI